MIGFLTALSRLCLFLVIALYWVRGDVVLGPRGLSIEPAAGVHLAILLAVLFLLTALRLWLVEIPGLLYSTTGPLVGASYTDLHAELPALRVSAVLAVIVAVAVLIGGFRRQLGLYGVLAIGAYVVVAVVGRGLFPPAMQKLLVAPTELTRETPYLRYHILATRQRLGDRQRRDPRAQRRGRSHAGRHPGQRADHRQRAALGPRPAAPDLRPAAGDPHVLRLRQRGRRPVLDRREIPAGPALAAGAERGVAPDPDLHQRASDVHPRHGAHARSGQPGHQRRTAGAVHQGPAAGLDRVAQDHPAADLLRRAGQRVRVRADPAARVRPPGRRDQRLRPLHRNGRRPGREPSPPAAARGPVRLLEDPAVAGHHQRQPGALLPRHQGARRAGAAVPSVRPRSLSRDRGRREARVDPRCLHQHGRLSVRRAGCGTAPTTCETASSSSSTPTTARSRPT